MIFGLTPPGGVEGAVYGARAIYRLNTRDVPHRQRYKGKYRTVRREKTEAMLDIPGDRQQVEGGNEAERKALVTWLNRVGLKVLKKHCEKNFITTDSDARTTVERDGYVLIASPRESYGYMFIGAWKAAKNAPAS